MNSKSKIIVTPEGWIPYDLLLNGNQPAQLPPPVITTPARQDNPNASIETKIGKFLLDCMSVTEERGLLKKIPSSAVMKMELGYSANTWQNRVNELKRVGLVDPSPAGTHITNDRNLHQIYQAIKRGEIDFHSPTGPEIVYHPAP